MINSQIAVLRRRFLNSSLYMSMLKLVPLLRPPPSMSRGWVHDLKKFITYIIGGWLHSIISHCSIIVLVKNIFKHLPIHFNIKL